MRKLRMYKGVTYHSGGWWANGYQYKGSRAASAIISYRSHDLTDDDHPELMRLKADPYEPVPKLEEEMRKNIRVYKGIIFDPTKKLWCSWNSTHESAASAIAWPPNGLTDDDHDPLMDLKKTPYEPTPKLEDVIRSSYDEWLIKHSGIGWKDFVAKRIREAFPHIDEENA